MGTGLNSPWCRLMIGAAKSPFGDVAVGWGASAQCRDAVASCCHACDVTPQPQSQSRPSHIHAIRTCTQIISSAIGNVPPPDSVLKMLTVSNKSKMVDGVGGWTAGRWPGRERVWVWVWVWGGAWMCPGPGLCFNRQASGRPCPADLVYMSEFGSTCA